MTGTPARPQAARVRSYRDLDVWKVAMELVLSCYRVANGLPGIERYGLASQIRRASVSITANIAEGHGRDYTGDYLRHVSIAKGSLTELETELLIAQRLEYVTADTIQEALQLAASVGKMLRRLSERLSARRTLNRRIPVPSP